MYKIYSQINIKEMFRKMNIAFLHFNINLEQVYKQEGNMTRYDHVNMYFC